MIPPPPYGRSKQSQASATSTIFQPRLAPVRTVVETHMSVDMPNATTVSAPKRRSLQSRSVPLKAELTLLDSTGSPANGTKPARQPLPGSPGAREDPGATDSWRDRERVGERHRASVRLDPQGS